MYVTVTLFLVGCAIPPKTHLLEKYHDPSTYSTKDMDLNQELNQSFMDVQTEKGITMYVCYTCTCISHFICIE